MVSPEAIDEGKVKDERVRALRERAGEARELARTCGNEQAAENILSYAAELEREADQIEHRVSSSSSSKAPATRGE